MNINDLSRGACLYWPQELSIKASSISSLGPLLETLDLFISILKTADKTPETWIAAVDGNTKISPNIFLKHLMVLSDVGGERLQRFRKDFNKLFPDNYMKFVWKSNEYIYTFNPNMRSAWTNKNLYVEKSVLLSPVYSFTQEMKDVCMLLLWGSAVIENENLPTELLEKCNIGTMLGNPSEIDTFVTQRYIVVSRITGGSTANDLGHICEDYVKEKLTKMMPAHISIGGHQITGVTHNNKNDITFDLVATNNKSKRCVGIEISFQVTTNSTIERKAGLATSRKKLMHDKNHKIAYVIDGSGNFQRKNAIETIINNSDCCVNFSDDGIEKLANFIIKETV